MEVRERKRAINEIYQEENDEFKWYERERERFRRTGKDGNCVEILTGPLICDDCDECLQRTGGWKFNW